MQRKTFDYKDDMKNFFAFTHCRTLLSITFVYFDNN